MKSFIKCTSFALTGIAALGVAAFNPVWAATSITVVSGGGAYATSQIEAYHKPFMSKTGVTVNSEDYNYELGPVRAQVESGAVKWDVVDMELSALVRGCEMGILEPIDQSILPPAPDGTSAQKDFIPAALNECGVGTIVWSTVYAYDKTKFQGEKPKTIADFFDIKKFPGKRGMKKWPKVNLEFALMADGVPTNEVYEVLSTPEGINRAFKVLDRIKDHIVWWEAGAQAPQLLADGEVVMTSAFNGRLFNAIVKEKKPFVIVWDGQVWDIDMWGIPKGSNNLDTALEFIKFSTDTQRLADQANWISYGPVRKSSMALVPEDIRPHLPTYPDNFRNALQNNFEWWADHQDEMNERFSAWLAK